LFQVDVGANGYYGFEVMDTCRPIPDCEAGDVDLSLLSYLDCCEQAYLEYKKRVPDADYRETFDYLTFHTPFGGMVKGAHRTMMRKMSKAAPGEIAADFERRVLPGIIYCQRVGNIMGGTMFMALASVIDQGRYERPKRIGCFSYGSGCCSEFFSGVIGEEAQKRQDRLGISLQLDKRYQLTMNEYELLLRSSRQVKFGTRNVDLDYDLIPGALLSFKGKERLCLKSVREYHREYEWA
jgi:polyketide biosynthesis 3-hydroxy-3-methylglutaryl-CoA synthase-like enzyme PksG